MVNAMDTWLTWTTGEETFLVKFFGAEYEQFRQRVSVGIPFIR